MTTKQQKTADPVDKLILARDVLSARIRTVSDVRLKSRLTRERQKLADKILESLEAQVS